MVAFVEGASEQRADRCDGIERKGEIDQARGSLALAFGDFKASELFFQPARPGEIHGVSSFVLRPLLSRCTAIDEAGPAPACSGQHIQNETAFAEFAPAEDKALIAPLHQVSNSSPSEE